MKLFNNRQGVRLHSHDVKYGSGSGQQVYLYSETDLEGVQNYKSSLEDVVT